MTAAGLVAVFVPVAATALLLDATRWPLGLPIALRYGLALGLGVSLGAIWFLLTQAVQSGIVATVAGDAALFGAAAFSRWRLSRSTSAPVIPWNRLQRGLLIALALSAAAAAVAVVLNAAEKPHGEWDAWAIWNLRARFLARGAPLRAAFDAAPNDYPLLWPSAVGRVWTLAGEETAAPLALAAALALAIALTLFGALSALRDRTLALLAVLCLLGTPAFVRNIAWQYADIPLAFAFLATLVLLAVRDRDPRRRRGALIWAGLAAGCGVLTKNEGLLFLVVLLVVETGRAIRRRDHLWAWYRAWAPFAAGLAPGLALFIVCKLSLAPPNDPLVGQSLALYTERLLDPSRYAIVMRTLAAALFPFGGPLLVALAAAPLLCGRTEEALGRSAQRWRGRARRRELWRRVSAHAQAARLAGGRLDRAADAAALAECVVRTLPRPGLARGQGSAESPPRPGTSAEALTPPVHGTAPRARLITAAMRPRRGRGMWKAGTR
jgi:hypothetical protein